MEIIVMVITLMQGIVIGLVGLDLVRRRKIEYDMLSSDQNHRNATTDLATLHNKTIEKHEELQSRLHALEMKVNQRDSNLGIKRF